MLKALFIFSVAFLLIACNSDDVVVGHYFKEHANTRSTGDIRQSNQELSRPFHKEAFMDFFKDGSYLMYVDQLEKGSYLKSDDTIFLQPENGSNWKFTLTFVAGLSHFKFPSGQLVSLQKLQNQHIDHYPFTYELNRWRESSPHPLSEGELIEKFQNYAAFMSAYMRWAQKTDQNLSLKYISGPLQYANNGLMMRKLEDTGSWCDFFYSGDCEKMDVILRNYFDGLIIDWQYTHDRILMLSDALLQIKKDMENYKPRFESSR